MKTEKKKNEFVKRLVTAGAVWAVAKALETPRISRMTKRIDTSIGKKKTITGKSLMRAGSNARRHAGLVLAGVAALAVAAGLLGRASMK